MYLVEAIVRLMHDTKDHRYVYVSDNPANLDAVSNYIISNVDLDARTTLIYLTSPEGAGLLSGSFNGVFLDSDVQPGVMPNMKPDAFTKLVNPINGTIE